MIFFSSLKQHAINFLEPYKTKEPATYAAAEQAIGAILMTDGFIGIDNPFGRKKRSGIFGTIGGMILGVIFMFIPTIFGNISGINSMTATTSATVVSVGQASYTSSGNGRSSGACPLTVSYSVNGQAYTQQSSISSSNYCSLTPGQLITINYNPASPGSWIYGAKTINSILQIFFWVGLLALISSIITFFIRLFSIIFGWKLLKDGRKNAAGLPPGTNLQSMIDEIKKDFTSSVFGFGGAQGIAAPGNIPNPPVSPINL
jgi:hypothetical protein